MPCDFSFAALRNVAWAFLSMLSSWCPFYFFRAAAENHNMFQHKCLKFECSLFQVIHLITLMSIYKYFNWSPCLVFPQCLKTKDNQDDVHVSFSQLLSELHKEKAPYALSVANRLYGEQSYEFLEVCFSMNGWIFVDRQQARI